MSDVIRQVIPGAGAIVGETAKTMLLSSVAVNGEQTFMELDIPKKKQKRK